MLPSIKETFLKSVPIVVKVVKICRHLKNNVEKQRMPVEKQRMPVFKKCHQL